MPAFNAVNAFRAVLLVLIAVSVKVTVANVKDSGPGADSLGGFLRLSTGKAPQTSSEGGLAEPGGGALLTGGQAINVNIASVGDTSSDEASFEEAGIGAALEPGSGEPLVGENSVRGGGTLAPASFADAGMLLYSSYTIKSLDMIGFLAIDFGLNQDTLVSVNGIKNTRTIQEGEILKIPNQDGIMHITGAADTLNSVAEKYHVNASAILSANELFSDKLKSGDKLFIPGAKLDSVSLQEINGDLFVWPTPNRYITSLYGWRISPITHTRLFHNGIDIRGKTGQPVYAAMAGRVTYVGYDRVYGNHIVISHHSGYRSMYAHLNSIKVKEGVRVTQGQSIGTVGSTGASTGSHLHFTVYKNGVTVNPRILTN
jgi:LysM repeat protein